MKNSNNHKSHEAKSASLTKSSRVRMLALFVLVALTITAAFSGTTSASSLDKFFENNLPAPIASSLSSVSHAFFGTTSTVSSAVTMAATVTTNKNDYAPGETAIITGTGFQAGEVVTLQVVHTDGTEEVVNDQYNHIVTDGEGHEPWNVTADANGSISTTWYVHPDDSLGATFLLTAKGGTSGLTAQHIFTDGPMVLEGQCLHTKDWIDPATNSVDPKYSKCGTSSSNDNKYVTGNIQGWQELEFIPVRVRFTQPVTNYPVTIEFDRTQGGNPGIENLTNFTASSSGVSFSPPVLSVVSADKWSYTFNVTIVGQNSGSVRFNARMSAGAHLISGSSLAMKGSDGSSILQIAKPGAAPGNPDLKVTKTGPASAPPSDVITYHLTYENKTTATSNATGVQLTDVLPSSVSYEPNSCSNASTNNSPCTVVGNTITWNFATLAPGAIGSATYQVRVNPNATNGQTFTNSAQILSAQNDANPTDNYSKVTTTVNVAPAAKKMPVISWSNPSAITYGTALSGTQLNAAASYNGASVAGTYSYNPNLGTVLGAGNNQTLSVTFTPTDTNTYDIPAAKTVQINVLKKELTVTADNARRAYGAANPSNLTHTITGYITGENSSVVSGAPALNIANTATATAAAGSTHAIAAALGTLAAANYSFGFVNGTLTIDKAVLQVSATGAMTYGGTPALSPSYSGFVNGDTASAVTGTPVLNCSTCSGAAAGSTQTINVADGNPALSAANYSFSFANGSLTVDKAVLQVSATGSMSYGGAPTLTPTYNGFITGESVSVLNGTAPALSCAGCAGAAAGSTQTITVAAGSLAASNYSFNFVNGNLTVNKASLQITASSPADISYGSAVPIITAGYAGFVTGESASNLTQPPSCGTAYAVGSGVGNYTTGCSGAISNNYTITYVPGSFKVNVKTLEIKASSPADISYGSAVPTVTPIYSGFVGSDSITTAPTCGTNYTVGSSVASYKTTCSGAAASANYVITYVSGGFNATKATAAVNAAANGKTYGDAEPTLGTTNSGFLAADLGAGKITFSASRAAGEGFGTYAITPAAADNNTGLLDNYVVTYNPANFSISKKDATWTTDNNSKIYGDAEPSPLTTGSGSGFLTVDGVSASYSRAAGNGVGNYAITANLSATAVGALNNYNITNNGANFEIKKKALKITASSPADIAYGSAVPTITPSYDGFITGDSAGNSLTKSPNCATNYTQGAVVGAYATSCSDAASNNYDISYAGGGFSVVKANQTINFGSLSNKFIGNGGITVSATGGASGNSVTFASSTPSVCTSGGTNGVTISFVGLGTCTITASQLGNGNYNAATGMSQSFTVNPDPTTITLDTTGHTFIDFDCTKNVIAATVKDSVTGLPIQNATVNFAIGTQSAIATTNNIGVASAAIVLNQPTGSVQASADYAGGGIHLANSASQQVTIGGSPNVGPGQNATSLYTGSLFFWTTSSTSSTATLTLSATIRDTFAYCPGDITKAKVSFYISTGGSFSPVSSAQNLPVGLVNPTDTSVGTASAISQYNIGNDQSVTLTVRVVVTGQYNLNTTTYDQLITIGKPGTARSLMGGGLVRNEGNPFPANGFLGLNSIESSFGSQVKYNNGGTNPQGQVQVYIRSCNKADGSIDPNCNPSDSKTHHVYFIKSNSISELSTIGGSASFGSKTNVSEVLANGTKIGLDGGGTMQIVFTPKGATIPRDMYVGSSAICANQQGCVSITAYKSAGGVWYSSAWGQGAGTTAPHTYVKNVLSGDIAVIQ